MLWLVFAFIGLTIVIRHVHASGQRKLLERRQELERWEYEVRDEVTSHTWITHFPTMRMQYRYVFYDGPGNDVSAEYLLRRTPAGVWENQPTLGTWKNEVNDLNERVKTNYLMFADAKERLEAIRGGPAWEPLSDQMTPALEVAYQRYVHQRT